MSSAIADASEGKCQDTVVASGDDIVDRETSRLRVSISRQTRSNFFFFLYERLIDEGSRAAYFYLPVLSRNSRIRLCIKEKLLFSASLFLTISLFLFLSSSLFHLTSRRFLISNGVNRRCYLNSV